MNKQYDSNQFYALMSDGTVKRIALDNDIVDDIKQVFITAGNKFKSESVQEIEFDGNFLSREGENILYVAFELPDNFSNIPDNQADLADYEILNERPKSIFYYDNGKIYFQIFNKRNLLEERVILRKLADNKFNKMTESAFIVDRVVHAIYDKGKLYFYSYSQANQIFPLKDFVIQATDQEIQNFENLNGVAVSGNSIDDVANLKTRRLIKSILTNNGVYDFNAKTPKTKRRLLEKYKVQATIDAHGNLVLPTNNVADLNRVLEFLNEDLFTGVITNKTYKSNSKVPE